MPPRSRVTASVKSTAGRGKAAGAGEVAKAAREVLPTLDSMHPAATLFIAAAERLAQDVDEASEVRDRVAAVRALIDVVELLDAAPPPPTGGATPVVGGDSDDDDRDVNPLGIPSVSPNVGYSPPPGAGDVGSDGDEGGVAPG
jgi:hypothetical protein